MFHTYMLKLRDGSFYTGHTNNLQRRLEEHHLGKGSLYVRGRRPFTLIYTEAFETRPKAAKREAQIKRMSLERKKALARSWAIPP
jgi:predicted GIY-YIG superfamily endonuclease